MVNVGVMWVRMKRGLVPVRMAMMFAGRVIRTVGVLVMVIVGVEVFMLHRFVLMIVFMAFGQVQPNSRCHEDGGETEADGQRVAQKQKRDDRAHEGSDGEVCARPCCADVTERQHEQRQAHAVAEEADYASRQQ